MDHESQVCFPKKLCDSIALGGEENFTLVINVGCEAVVHGSVGVLDGESPMLTRASDTPETNPEQLSADTTDTLPRQAKGCRP